jgi:hypothetical protein
MSRILNEVDAAIARMPWSEDEKSRVHRRARGYDHACGCGFSAACLVLAILSGTVLLVRADPFSWRLIPFCVIGVFCAGLAGKAIGVGWARVRLLLLHRSLVRPVSTSRGVLP